MTNLPERLRDWTVADMDTHAVLRCCGLFVAEVPFSPHARVLIQAMQEAARWIEFKEAEIARLQNVVARLSEDLDGLAGHGA